MSQKKISQTKYKRMNKELEKALKKANKELKEKNFFLNYELVVEGDFTTEYNQLYLQNKRGHTFPVTYVETVGEALRAVEAYMTGLRHGGEKSYPKLCDHDNY